MTSLSRLVVAAVIAAAISPVALAASTMAPVPPLLGDGYTSSRLLILSDVPAAKLKIKPERGRIGTITPVQGGYAVDYLPPVVSSPTSFNLDVSVRTPGFREDFEATVDVVPGYTSGFELEFDTAALATDQTASVKVRPTGRTAQADNKRRPWLTVSAGEVTALVPSGDGTWVARYTPPADLEQPTQAAFFVADGAAPAEVHGTAALPVTVRRSITLDAPPDSSCILMMAGEEYGPMSASPSGKVAFDVALHPAHPTATLRSVTPDGSRSDDQVDLPMEVLPSLVIAPLPPKGPANKDIPLFVYGVGPDGRAVSVEELSTAASQGTVGAIVEARAGLGSTTWTLPAEGEDVVTIAHGEAHATHAMTVVGGPVVLALSSEPTYFEERARDFAITARVKDTKGTGLVGRLPRLAVTQAQPMGKPVDNEDGTYTQKYRLDYKKEWARVAASPDLQPTGLPVRQLVAWPEDRSVTGDGNSSVDLLVVAEDALGMPVPGVELTLSVPMGDGSLPPTATTGDDGLARVAYRAGITPGLVTLSVGGAGMDVRTTLWQGGMGIPAPELAPTGSKPLLEALERWKDSFPALTLDHTPPVEAVAGAPAGGPTLMMPGAFQPGTQPPPQYPPQQYPPQQYPPQQQPPQYGQPAYGQPYGQQQKPGRRGTKQPRAATTGDYARARIRGGVATAPFSYRSEGDAEDYAPRATFQVSPWFGAVGVDPQAEMWFGQSRTWGLDVSARAGVYQVLVGEDTFMNFPIDAHLGPRYRFYDSGGLFSAYASLSFQYTQGLVFAYSNEAKTAAELVNYPLYAGRVAAGMRFERGKFLTEVEVSETLGPWPVITRADVVVDIPLGQAPVALYAGLAVEHRALRFQVEGTAELKVRQTGEEIRVGITLPVL